MATLRTMPANIDEILESVPRGAWVALSREQDRVVAYAAELRDAVQKAHDLGELHPVVLRKPLRAAALLV